MPKSALPPHLQDIENHFPDDKQFGYGSFGRLYTWFNQTTKTWFAFSYRCTEWWARWRKYPKVLFAVGGKGLWRYESESQPDFLTDYLKNRPNHYLSRIQKYKRWHVAVQWPLIVSAHIYPKAKDVPSFLTSNPETDGKLWFFYWNHFDADLVYWMILSLFIGRNWK